MSDLIGKPKDKLSHDEDGIYIYIQITWLFVG